jgi:hypothetical protein
VGVRCGAWKDGRGRWKHVEEVEVEADWLE